jgi:hypothetical protein
MRAITAQLGREVQSPALASLPLTAGVIPTCQPWTLIELPARNQHAVTTDGRLPTTRADVASVSLVCLTNPLRQAHPDPTRWFFQQGELRLAGFGVDLFCPERQLHRAPPGKDFGEMATMPVRRWENNGVRRRAKLLT